MILSPLRGSAQRTSPGFLQQTGLLTVLLCLLVACYAQAQDYRFSVPRVVFDVTVQKDGSALLQYEIEFQNASGAHPIDIVDIGLPIAKYKISNMKADLDGEPRSTIKRSQVVNPGVEVHLDEKTIPPEGSGVLHFEATIPGLVFSDTTRKDYVSFQITPTWFGEQYVVGNTDLTIRAHLPEGLQADEVLYQQVPFTGKETQDGQVVVSWNAQTRFTSEYRIGVSFPSRVMSQYIVITQWDLIKGWITQNRNYFLLAEAALFLFFVIFGFRRLTGGTGSCLLIPILFISFFAWGISWVNNFMHLAAWIVLLGFVIVVEWARRRKRMKYLPAIASVEGGGIKRGLTAPEAAILLELPVNKVITMVLFGLVKKGLIQQTPKDPVAFKVNPDSPADVILNGYEKEMLGLLGKREKNSAHHEARMQDMDLTSITDALINSVVSKMKGFNVAETREYYQHIISRAWVEAKGIGDIDAWQKTVDEKIDWMMLDRDFDNRFQPYITIYSPTWYSSFPTMATGGRTGGISLPKSEGGSTRFSDIAASLSGWMENTAGSVVTKLEGQQGGLVNLTSLDKSYASSGSGGGHSSSGGGGGCACACAGCACACACAGGGR